MSNFKENEQMDTTTEERPRSEARRVKINVGGTVYAVAASTILKYPQTMLGAMLSLRWEQQLDEELFIDRDPVRFRYILDFYRDGKISIPVTMSKMEIIREAEYFALPVSEIEIKFEASDIVGLREAVTTFENSLVESFHEEARRRSVVACAYEIAALLIKKMRACPDAETIDLGKEEIPPNTFAYVLCSEVLNDPIFKETITGLVQQAGYHFAGDINSGQLPLSRARR